MPITWTRVWYDIVGKGTAGDDVATDTQYANELSNTNDLWLYGGNDLAVMGWGNDTVRGGQGNDTASGGVHDDWLLGEDGNDILNGDSGNDVIYGGTGADAMYGGSGHDVLDSSIADGFSDNLSGGDGHDTYHIRDAFDIISGEAGFTSATSRDTIELYISSFDMNRTADTQAIEVLQVRFGSAVLQAGASVRGSMNANTIIGGIGGDSINGDAGNDVVEGGSGFDSLRGGLGDDTISGQTEADTIWGDNGLDKLFGGISADTIYGGNQNDEIDGGADSDALYGDAGDDTVWGERDPGLLATATDRIYGGTGNDRLYGGVGFDSVYGDDGNDTVDGGTGNDQMYGGLGDDRFYVDSVGDQVVEAAGAGNDFVYTALTTYNNNFVNVERVIYQGPALAVNFFGGNADDFFDTRAAASAQLFGFGGNDILYGSNGSDLIDGGEGNDVLTGFGGNDTLRGELGADVMSGGMGNDVYWVYGADTVMEDANAGFDTVRVWVDGSYTLGANIEAGIAVGDMIKSLSGNALDNTLTGSGYTGLVLIGLGGNDRLTGTNAAEGLDGGTGNDTLTGSGGNDTLNGDFGADVMQGGTGNDTYYVDNAGDRVVESIFGNGVDTVWSNINWTLADDVENLIFYGVGAFQGTGGAGDNRIQGGLNGDVLMGMGGNDVIVGRGGADSIYGGAGADRFEFSSSAMNAARIFDFQSGVDKLVLNAGGWTASYVDADTTRFTSTNGGTVTVDGMTVFTQALDVLFI